jgi:hypothetical protein
MKKHLLHGLGPALMLASPIWLTIEKPPNYFNFAIGLALGILLLVLARLSTASKTGKHQPTRSHVRNQTALSCFPNKILT